VKLSYVFPHDYGTFVASFLVAFAKLRKATINLFVA